MKPEELRLGNLITVAHESNIPVIKINSFYESGIVEKYGKSHKFSLLLPIELTEEWLMKFGFEKANPRAGIAAAYKKGGIRISISNSGNFYWKNKPIYCVHILQNVYYFNELTGEELKTKE